LPEPNSAARVGDSARVLARVPPGVEKVYDRHHYLPEKRAAFEKLAELIERIVNPPRDTVVTLVR
jgi:hypothetical protein